MSLQPPDLRHEDPVIQRLLDWLKAKLIPAVDEEAAVGKTIMEGFGNGNSYGALTFGMFADGTLRQVNLAALPALRSRRLADEDFAVAGRKTQLRLRAQIGCNATAPAITFTFELRPITIIGGGAGNVTYGLGAPVVSAQIVTPPASTITSAVGEIDFPADGNYVLTLTTSGVAAANHQSHSAAYLEVRHV